jgi:hypothetical protein
MSVPVHIEAPDPADDRIGDRHFHGEANWPKLIKALREFYDLSIYEAEAMALAHRGWRRWCQQRINADPECRKQALWHIRHHGDASLFVRDGDRLKVRSSAARAAVGR